ncbi:hypothetical protein SOCEGT47_083420 [Sorangium cellulosum]|uniref:DUF2169 domain-containing protein n=1 Tax=Sorangium cellulosum TaxID=56 RepID=A0A4P2QD88_SORCE|nr:DUF2169 domain-containing protein [Sorangium cellulosum]AUX27744.1 hypothetical protein SOCEGT47_083420 [Sorangium cellulosum]
MNVITAGPLPAASILWQPQAGAWVLTVVCKATFLLRPGEALFAPEQDPPSQGDATGEEAPSRSLQSASDLAPAKPRADVVLVGFAFAPGKVPVRSLMTRMIVGDVDKSIEVWCDRVFSQDGALHEGPPFAQMPLVYERAAGGPGSWNPVGVSGASRNAYGQIAVPNLQPPGLFIAEPGKSIEPVGFGPIAPTWPSRVEKLGRHAAGWSHRDWSRKPLPAGLDLAYFNIAPADQQLPSLREDERLVLENLHPEHPRLVTNLPGLRPVATVEGRRGGSRQVAMRCDTLWIDAARGRCSLTYRAQIALEHPEERGRVVVSLEPSQLARTEAERSLPPTSRRAGLSATQTQVPALKPEQAPVLPWKTEERGADGAPHSGRSSAGLPFRAPGAQSSLAALPVSSVVRQAPPPAPPPPAPPPPPPAPPVEQAPLSALAPAPWAADAAPPMTVGQRIGASEGAARAPLPRPPEGDGDPRASAPRPAAAPPDDIVELLWFDPDALPRVRARWRELILELDFEEIDPRHDLPADDAAAAKDRHHVLGVLTDGSPIDPGGVHKAILASLGDRKRFAPPLVLVTGEARFPFDELEALKATVAVVTPLAGLDKQLKDAIDSVGELLKSPYLQSSTGVVDRLTQQLKEHLAQSHRALPAGQIEAYTERLLLEQRRYQTRKVLGDVWIRALLAAGGQAPMPLYLPRALEHRLPMMTSLKVRVLAEAHLRQDQIEPSRYALKALALGRVFTADELRPARTSD